MSNTQHEYEILDFVSLHSPAYRIDVLNNFDPQNRCGDTQALIEHLVSVGLLKFSPAHSDYLKLTPAGVHALALCRESRAAAQSAEQDKVKQQAEAHAKESRDRRFQVELLFIGGAITLFIEHFHEIIHFVGNLLKHLSCP